MMSNERKTKLKGLAGTLYEGKRIVNFRPVFFLSLSFGLGIFFSFLMGFKAFWLNFLLIPVAAFVFLRAGKRRALLLFFAALFAVYSLGVLSYELRISAYERVPVLYGNCAVRGEVEKIGRTEKTDVFTFGSLTIFDETGACIETDYRMQVYVYGDSGAAPLSVGSVAVFETSPETYELWSYGRLNATAVIGGVRYRAFASPEDFIVLEDKGADPFSAVNTRIGEVVFSSMDGETASLAFAMLTGNSGFLDEEILQNYRYGGIAHIFAVSGLHIGIIYGILSLVLRKLRLRAPVRIPLIAAALTFYAGVCGFSPSSLRAVVMCIVPMLAEAFGSECDRLNSVSLAASAVLFINPVYLFSIGFQLSLAATAGIILLGGRLSRLASRVRFLPQKISSALCISFSAQVFTLPILLDSFGYISGLSLLLNLLFIPVFSAVFSLLFVFTVLSCILPFASEVLLWLPGNLLRLSVLPVSAFEFDVLLISGFSFGALAVLWYLLCWLNTDKINLKAVPKACLSVLLCIALTLGMVFRNGTFFYDALISAHSYYGSNIVIVRREGRTSLIATGIPDGEYLETLFLRERITSLDAVAVLAPPSEINTAVPVILRNVSFRTLWVPASCGLPDVFSSVEIERTEGTFSFGGIYAFFAGEETLCLNLSDVSFIVSASYAGEDLPPCSVLIAEGPDDALFEACDPETEIYFAKAPGKLSVFSSGDLQIGVKDAIISVKETA